MKLHQRRAVSPIIATLLLIAIAVASGVIVYVFTGSLASSLTKNGDSQVAQQVELLAYNFVQTSGSVTCDGNLTETAPCLVLYLQNTGSSTLTISQIYFNGMPLTAAGTMATAPITLAAGGRASVMLVNAVSTASKGYFTAMPSSVIVGASYNVKIVTADGGQAIFNVVAGQSG